MALSFFGQTRLKVSVCLTLLLATGSLAQDRAPLANAVGQPTVIVSTSKVEQLLANMTYLMRSVNQPEIGGMVTMTVNQFSRGLDRTRPIGLAVSLNAAGNPIPVVLLPIVDLKAFFAGLAGFGEPEDLGDGLYTMDVGPRPVFAKQLDNWLLVGQQEDSVKDFKQVPAELLQTLATRYDIGVKLDVQSIPLQVRDFLLSQLKDSYQRSAADQKARMERELERAATTAKTEEEKAVVEARRAALATAEQIQDSQVQQVEDLINSTKQIVVGLLGDSANKQLVFELASEFVAGSKLDAQAARSATAKTKMAGVQSSGQAISLAFTDVIDPMQIPQLEQWASASLDALVQGTPKYARDPGFLMMIGELKSIVTKSIQDGVIDGAASVTLADGLNLVASTHVADAKQFAASLQKVSKEWEKDPKAPRIQFGVSKHQGADIHLGAYQLPSDASPAVKKVFGESVSFAIATSDKEIYLAIGTQAETQLKSTLDRVSKAPAAPGTPMELKIELEPILTYIHSIQPTPITEMMIQAVQNSTSNDMLVVKSQIIPHGALVRITVEEGLLRAVGSAVKASQGNRRAGGF